MRAITVLIVLALLLTPCAALAAGEGDAAQVQETQQAAQVQETQQAAQGQGAVGGIKPVSPEEFSGKLNRLGDKLYETAGPVTDTVAKIVIALAGVCLILFLAFGAKVVSRAVGAALAVALGLGLWYGAPYLVGMVKWVVAWLQS
ncbi:MAG: hypothetical protein AB1426_12355 [Bacillota bacterium]